MALSKTNIAVVLLVGFVNYLEWAVVMTSIYPYILSVSIGLHIALILFIYNLCYSHEYLFIEITVESKTQMRPEMVSNVQI